VCRFFGQQVVVFLEITVDDALRHSLVGLDILAYGRRLQKQQNSLSRILVRIVLSANLMDDVVAECHVSECSGLAWRPKFRLVILKNCLHFLSDNQMVRIVLTVDQVSPIEVAGRSPFTSRKRTKNDEARIFRRIFRNFLE